MSRIAVVVSAAVLTPLALLVAGPVEVPVAERESVAAAPESGTRWGTAQRGTRWG